MKKKFTLYRYKKNVSLDIEGQYVNRLEYNTDTSDSPDWLDNTRCAALYLKVCVFDVAVDSAG